MSETGPPAEITDPAAVATWSDLPDREPTGARVAGVDLVVARYDDAVSVLYGRCQHRDVLLAVGGQILRPESKHGLGHCGRRRVGSSC